MKSCERASGIVGLFDGAVVGLPLDVFEEFVDIVTAAGASVGVVAGGDDSGKGEIVFSEMLLDGVGEGDASRASPAGGAFLEQELAAVGYDSNLGAFAGAAFELGYGFDDAEVIVTQDHGELLGFEALSGSIFQIQPL